MSGATEAQQRGRLPQLSAANRVRLQEYALVGVVIVLLIVGAILEPDSFLTSDNMLNVLRQSSVVGVLAIGMTFVIATAGIDLSVGSMVAAAGIAGGLLVDSGSLAFMLGALAMGIALGGINASAIAYGKVVPFIATLAMFAMARGLALWMSDKTPISLFQAEGVRWFGNGEVVGIPSAVIVFVAVTAIGWVLLNRTRYGRHVVAVGGNREAARIAGVKVQRIVFSVYVLSGLCVGIAAILLCGRLSSASPVAGNLYELDAIAAVVIGGLEPGGRPRHDRRDVPRRPHVRPHLQPAHAHEPRGRGPARHQGADHPRRRAGAAQGELSIDGLFRTSKEEESVEVVPGAGGVPRARPRRRRLWRRRQRQRRWRELGEDQHVGYRGQQGAREDRAQRPGRRPRLAGRRLEGRPRGR
jgi:ribose transport system permease protein